MLEDADAGEAAARAAGCEVWRIGEELALSDLPGRLGLPDRRVAREGGEPRRPVQEKWTAVIPAAGRGTRLGSDRPKILFEIAGRTILDWLLDLLLPRCGSVVLVAAPRGVEAISRAVSAHGDRVRIAVQPDPIGMADAVERGTAPVTSENVLVIWGDQAAVREESLDLSMSLHTESCALATVPTVWRSGPYIHFARDASGRIVEVAQAREGDGMPQEGESDAGVFLFRTGALKRSLEAMRCAGVGIGRSTKEWNLLPVFPLLDSLAGNVLTAPILTAEESTGVNTPADAAFLESVLLARKKPNGISCMSSPVEAQSSAGAASQIMGETRLHNRLRVVMFSGGSGTRSIANFLLRHPQVDLTVLVNCYDDGHSTGRLRRFIPGMLGPSDIRKNVARMMPADSSHVGLAQLSDYRLEKGAAFDPSIKLIRAMAELRPDGIPKEAAGYFDALTVRQARTVAQYCKMFLDYQSAETVSGNLFDFNDCAIGNIIFAGCYLQNRRDFNATVAALCADYDVKGTLLNVTQGENLFLVAIREDGTLIRTEGEIVSSSAKAGIRQILLISESFFREKIEPADVLPNDPAIAAVVADEVLPEVNPRCAQALCGADMIIYGPGTQHSSLLPSYLTRGVAQAIASNRLADKVFIANVRRDHDIPLDSVNDLADKLLDCLRRGGGAEIKWEDAVSQFLVQDQRDKERGGSNSSFDMSLVPVPGQNGASGRLGG